MSKLNSSFREETYHSSTQESFHKAKESDPNFLKLPDDDIYSTITRPTESNYNSNNAGGMIFDFKLEGMTCVSCSNTIESTIKKEFGDRGLVSV
jgi:hypothetical protein